MKTLKWILFILVCAWLGQYLLALAIPNLMMEILYNRGGNQIGYNQLVVVPDIDESSRSVVRPSPDLLYASCVYNLADGPVLIAAPVPEHYWSMQFYQMNTDNYAGITNQREERVRIGSTVKVTLIGPDEQVASFSGEVIQSPTERGIMLLRASAIKDRALQRLALKSSLCKPGSG
jgi:uncharacterized membrane protein